MRDLDFTSLRIFIAVCERRNFAQVAQQENLVPSAVSKRMAQLEEDVGAQLLVRSRRGVAPTPAGMALLEHCHSLRTTLARIERDMSAYASGVRGHVRLLASASALAEFLPDDIAEFLKNPQHQAIQVDLEERLSGEVVKALRDGSASVGVCWDVVDLQGLVTYPYRSDHLAIVAHPDHALVAALQGRAWVHFAETLQYEHAGILASSAVQDMLHRAAALAGKPLVYRAVVSNFDAAIRIVRANLGISVVPREVAQAYGPASGLRIIDLADGWAARRFAICLRDASALTPAAMHLVAHLQRKGQAASAAG